MKENECPVCGGVNQCFCGRNVQKVIEENARLKNEIDNLIADKVMLQGQIDRLTSWSGK